MESKNYVNELIYKTRLRDTENKFTITKEGYIRVSVIK